MSTLCVTIATSVVFAAICAVILAVWIRVFRLARLMAMPSALSACIAVAALLYVSWLLPGAVGVMYTPVVYGVFVMLSVVFLAGRPKLQGTGVCDSCARFVYEFRLTGVDLGMLFSALLFSRELITYARYRWLASIIDPGWYLAWDAVSYHIPGFVEFWQNHSLWSMEGRYQSYSFGFELIANFFSPLFFAHWNLGIANLFAVMLMLLSISASSSALKRSFPDSGNISVSCGVLAIGLWSWFCGGSIADVGKNDVFMSGCLVSSLAFLLQASILPHDAKRSSGVAILMLSVSLGLALATKPTALAFVPFFAVSASLLAGGSTGRSGALRTMAFVGIMAAALGGFWMFRNLVVLGSLSGVSGAWELSMAANFKNPALYELKRESLLFLIGIAAIIPGMLLLYMCKARRTPVRPVLFLVLFHVVACLAFVITPHSIFHATLAETTWKLRLGMPLFVSASLIYSIALSVFAHEIVRAWTSKLNILALAVVFAIIMVLPIVMEHRRYDGLAGYEEFKGLPRTDVYRWVRALEAPQRIYSAGLKPYGLYGKRWNNRVRYNGHSRISVQHLEAEIKAFKPDLIFISVDPDEWIESDEKPGALLDWFRQHSVFFEEVFCDQAVSGYRVLDAARVHFKYRN